MQLPFIKKKFFFFLGILLIIFSLNLFVKDLRSFIYSFSAPLQSFLWNTGGDVSKFFASFLRMSALKKENERLLIENFSLKQKLVEFGALKKENEQLRQAFNLNIPKNFEVQKADILGKDFTADLILISQGKSSGIEVGMPVITPSKVLVGRIVEVFQNTSRVMLISHPQSAFDAKIQRINATGLLKGKGRFRATLELIPKEKDLSQGDIVTTSKIGGIFPDNLLVGTVETIQKTDPEPFQKAEIKLSLDLESSDILFIIKKQNSSL